MKNIIKSKSLISVILSISIIFIAFPLSGSSLTNNATHKKTITQFIDDVRTIQNQVFYLAQFALENPPRDRRELVNNIKLVNDRIVEVDKNIQDYLKTVPNISFQNRDALLLMNALNFTKNALYELELLSDTTSNVDRVLILEEFFRFRQAAIDILNSVENVILRT